jgi:hypothetical protein
MNESRMNTSNIFSSRDLGEMELGKIQEFM